MKATLSLCTALLAALASAPLFAAPASVGAPAPEFSVTDSKGQKHSLSQFKGKTVVLEWNNPECPFVKKHYGAGNMQQQQAAATKGGAVWLTVNSGAKGKQGYMDGAAADAYVKDTGAKPSAYVLDTDGTVGKAYGAKTTPHMYVIDGQGVLLRRRDRLRAERRRRRHQGRDPVREPGPDRALSRKAGERVHLAALRVLGEVRVVGASAELGIGCRPSLSRCSATRPDRSGRPDIRRMAGIALPHPCLVAMTSRTRHFPCDEEISYLT